jgi:hypothetical protein
MKQLKTKGSDATFVSRSTHPGVGIKFYFEKIYNRHGAHSRFFYLKLEFQDRNEAKKHG